MLNVKFRDKFEFVCRDKNGKEKWRETIEMKREPPPPPSPSLGASGLALVLLLGLLLTPLAWLAPIGLIAFSMLGLITNVGLDHVLDTQFTGSAQVGTWYLGLIDDSGFTAIAAADTMASHAGWTELTTYDEATRVEWDEDATAGQVIANTTLARFTMNAVDIITGAFLTSVNVKGGATGVLFSAAQFDEGNRAVVATDTLDITYSLSASDN